MGRRPVKIIHMLHVICAQAFYKWAMNNIPHTIGLTHPDVNKIILRQHQLEEKWRRLW